MDVNVFEECETALKNDQVEGRRRFVNKAIAAVEIRLERNGHIPPHSTEEDVFFYILEGEGTLVIGDESRAVVSGMVSHCPSGIKKGIVNDLSEMLRVLVVKMT